MDDDLNYDNSMRVKRQEKRIAELETALAEARDILQKVSVGTNYYPYALSEMQMNRNREAAAAWLEKHP
jgi:uncharacterized coiled-coil protein SlyX